MNFWCRTTPRPCVGKFLAVVVVDLLPQIPEPVLQIVLEHIDQHIDPLVVDAEIPQFEQVLDPLHLLPDVGLLFLNLLPELLPLRKVHQVHNHRREVVRKVAVAQEAHYLAEDLVAGESPRAVKIEVLEDLLDEVLGK